MLLSVFFLYFSGINCYMFSLAIFFQYVPNPFGMSLIDFTTFFHFSACIFSIHISLVFRLVYQNNCTVEIQDSVNLTGYTWQQEIPVNQMALFLIKIEKTKCTMF